MQKINGILNINAGVEGAMPTTSQGLTLNSGDTQNLVYIGRKFGTVTIADSGKITFINCEISLLVINNHSAEVNLVSCDVTIAGNAGISDVGKCRFDDCNITFASGGANIYPDGQTDGVDNSADVVFTACIFTNGNTAVNIGGNATVSLVGCSGALTAGSDSLATSCRLDISNSPSLTITRHGSTYQYAQIHVDGVRELYNCGSQYLSINGSGAEFTWTGTQTAYDTIGIKQGTTVAGFDFSQYKRVKIYIRCELIVSAAYDVVRGIVDVDLSYGSDYFNSGFTLMEYTGGQFNTIASVCSINSDKDEILFTDTYLNSVANIDTYTIYKIEGVL